MKRLSNVLIGLGIILLATAMLANAFWSQIFGFGSPPLPNDAGLEARLQALTDEANRQAATEWMVWCGGVITLGSGIIARLWAKAKR